MENKTLTLKKDAISSKMSIAELNEIFRYKIDFIKGNGDETITIVFKDSDHNEVY